MPDLEQLRYNNRRHHQSQHRSKRRLMFIPDVKCDEIDQILIYMAEGVSLFLNDGCWDVTFLVW